MSYIKKPTKSFELGETIVAGELVEIIGDIAYNYIGLDVNKLEGFATVNGTIGQTNPFIITSVKFYD